MKVEKDFEDFIKLLNKYKVKYLIVEAYALALYAEPRNTGDIDVLLKELKIMQKKYYWFLKSLGLKV